MMNCYLIIILNDVQVGAVGRFEGSVYCREGKRIVEVQSQWEMAEKQANGVVTATVGPVFILWQLRGDITTHLFDQVAICENLLKL